MRTLNFYEIGVDSLPYDGSTIYMFDKTTSFDMFDSHHSICGTVQYMYADFGDTLEDALSKGVKLCIDKEEYDEQYNLVGISINLSTTYNEYVLRRGLVWCYEHEYLTMLDDTIFPFQCSESFDCAVNNKVITIEQTSKVKLKLIAKQRDSGVKSIVYTTYVVLYNNRRFNIKFVTINGIAQFREYSVYE